MFKKHVTNQARYLSHHVKLLLLILTTLLGTLAFANDETTCDLERPIIFAGQDWDSNAFHTEVAQFILTHGYGCQTDAIPGSTIPLINGLAKGDIDIIMEIWKETVADAWKKAAKRNQVIEVGSNFPDAKQAWYIPKYLVEGEQAPAKDLKSVSDLPRYKTLFKDPEEPDKGRFYNCIAGWNCETVNSKKLRAYGLQDDFVNFRPGTGAALNAAIESAIKRKKPILFYYWGPSWMMGKVGDDIIALDEPTYDKAIWDDMRNADNPTRATAYPVVHVIIGANRHFAEQSPTIMSFLKRYETNSKIVSDALRHMQDTGASVTETAQFFLKNNEALWTTWVPEDVAQRVKATLDTL